MWQVVSESPRSMRYAAQNDMGMIMWRPSVATLKDRLRIYQEAYEEFHGVKIPFGAKTAILRDTFVAESEAEARRIAEESVMGSLNFSNWRGPRIFLDPGETLDSETEESLKKHLPYDFVKDRALFFGSVDEVVDQIKYLYSETRMELINLKVNWPGLDHEPCMANLNLLAKEVLPRVRQWHAETFGASEAAE